MDTSNQDARRAIASVLDAFARWRQDLARFSALADRPHTESEAQVILGRCIEMEGEVMAARTSLLIALADAPPRVAGNSRVVDVERALDNTEASLSLVRMALNWSQTSLHGNIAHLMEEETK